MPCRGIYACRSGSFGSFLLLATIACISSVVSLDVATFDVRITGLPELNGLSVIRPAETTTESTEAPGFLLADVSNALQSRHVFAGDALIAVNGVPVREPSLRGWIAAASAGGEQAEAVFPLVELNDASVGAESGTAALRVTGFVRAEVIPLSKASVTFRPTAERRYALCFGACLAATVHVHQMPPHIAIGL
jgi:hypothetical protein